MKPNYNQTLWNRIEAFSIDDPLAGYTFSKKLTVQNSWTPAFTAKAIAEYKRFIFLCCISPTGASPSQIVDEVWHLHLTYTHNYWKEFCGQTLQKEIHHHPSKGGDVEADKHRDWYAETLTLYKEVFEEYPPTEIWPKPDETTIAAKPEAAIEPTFIALYKKYVYILLLPFLFPFLFGKLHPFALKGPQFLWFYLLLLIAAVVYYVRVKRGKEQAMKEALKAAAINNANSFQIARYVFGKTKAVEAAVVDLVSKGILIAEPKERFSFYPAKVDAPTKTENPLAANLLKQELGLMLLMTDMVRAYKDGLAYHAGLARLCRAVVKKEWVSYVAGTSILLVGLARMIQGLHNGYPVAYLQILMLAGGFVLLGIVTSISSQKLLQEIFTEGYKRQEFIYAKEEPILQKFIFLGATTLAGSYAFANLEQIFKRHATPSDGNGSSGCSSGCGSSCGSGCGGGCGGCGGGD